MRPTDVGSSRSFHGIRSVAAAHSADTPKERASSSAGRQQSERQGFWVPAATRKRSSAAGRFIGAQPASDPGAERNPRPSPTENSASIIGRELKRQKEHRLS